MTSNLVTTTPTRFTAIRPDLLPPMKVLEEIDSDTVISERLAKFKELWTEHDPPAGAQFDVERLEFDPVVITQELSAYFETLVRDRVNQAAKAITLAFATGSDLDAIASRYPYGIPRLAIVASPRGTATEYPIDYEDDATYRQRIWLSPSILSLSGPGQATFESYIFWALSATIPADERAIKHATAQTVRASGNIYVTLLSVSDFNEEWTISHDKNTYTLATGYDPTPSSEQKSAVYQYITAPNAARMGLTDVVNVVSPKVTDVDIDIEVWLFPGVNKTTLMEEVCEAIVALLKAIMWLGADLTDLSLKGALAQAGVYRVNVKSPVGDVIAGLNGIIRAKTVTLIYRGTGE